MVNNKLVAFVFCSCLLAFSNAAVPFPAWTVTPPSTPLYVGILSDPWVVTVSWYQAAFTSSVTLSLSTSDGSTQFFPSTLTFGPTAQSLSFRLIPGITDVSVVLSSSDAAYDVPTVPTMRCALRGITVDPIPQSLYVNVPSEPLKITLQFPPTQGTLTLVPSTTANNITFQPPSIDIPIGSNSGSFEVIALASTPFPQYVAITWTLIGYESSYYQNGTFPADSVQSFLRPIYTSLPPQVLMGDNSTVLYVWTNDRVNDTVTIIPTATDTIFTPSQMDLTPNISQVAFTINATTPVSGTTGLWIIEGPGAVDYVTVVGPTFTAPLKTVTVVSQKVFVLNKKGQVSLRIAAPVVSSLQVFLFAANLAFNPTNVTFAGLTTSMVVDVMPFANGTDSISFTISGDDVEYYSPVGDVKGISIVAGQFSSWYTPTLWIGYQSDSIPVRVNIAPESDVTLTLFCPDVIFNPPTLKFTAGNLQQYFTITPTFTGTASTDDQVSSSSINFLVGGTDWASYGVPEPVAITAYRRTIQTVWAPHLSDVNSILQLYLQKTYIVWIVANHVTDPFTVTPVNPYMTFNPPILQFTSSNKHLTFQVTVTGVTGSTTISYLIGGQNGGLYQSIPDDVVNTDFRPLAIINAVISPDNRVPGVLITSPSYDDLASNNIYAFELQSAIIPDGSLTITPHSDHITFNPSSITLSNTKIATSGLTTYVIIGGFDYYEFVVPNTTVLANFSVTPLASGIHEVWFVLSGSDAPYYYVPPHTKLSFLLEERVTSDEAPKIISSSSRLMIRTTTSLLVVVLLLVLSIILM
jgi:hypothetical protein